MQSIAWEPSSSNSINFSQINMSKELIQTSEGFTPLMISIIYHGDKVLELLLQLGGVDLSII